ncbi:TPA: DUF1015 domain-containing protein [Candidatus Woesearchaeota archaeon]|nr:DUF1015 domain-containing protein [Candidatus Woesearchaeota archaeon]
MNLKNIALHIPTILLPNKDIDLTRWAVIACDQYTSQPEYWAKVKGFVGESPSTLNLMLPEACLESENREEVIQDIHRRMEKYLADGTLICQKPGFILVDRKTPYAASRKGLIVALDLEGYDYSKGSRTLVRPTEGVIPERLPSRIRIRENAAIELPHIMVLVDDPGKTVIEPLFEKNLEKLYDFELMMGSGHVEGYMIDDGNTISEITNGLSRLTDPEAFNKKYGFTNKPPLLYAVGDGNHSLATAKSVWEKIKERAEDKKAIMNHPARYALVELVNVHDPGLRFEPIHRVVFNVNFEGMLQEMRSFYTEQGSGFSYKTYETKEEMQKEFDKLKQHEQSTLGELLKQKSLHIIPFVAKDSHGLLIIKDPKLNIEVATLQSFLDTYLKSRLEASIDYIHGTGVVTSLASKPGSIGFYPPAIPKHELFRTVILDGALPRKTFSMGAADEKRFYLECRRITLLRFLAPQPVR